MPNMDRPDTDILIIVGNFGSGKTEVSVNLALHLRRMGLRVQIADLDIVNPYFRCREAQDLMEAEGIRVVVPPRGFQWADLPIVLPEIKGMLDQPGSIVIFDVGGDDIGARMLSSFAPLVLSKRYKMLQVVNERRPFTDSPEGVLKIMGEIEGASRLRVAGLISNAHLMEETTVEVVLRGIDLCRAVAHRSGRPIEFVAAPRRLDPDHTLSSLDIPILWLDRIMLPPHLEAAKDRKADPTRERAPRPRPLWAPRREAG